MSPLSLSPLRLSSDDIAEVAGIYASNPEYGRTSGEYDPARIQAQQVEPRLRCPKEAAGTASDRAMPALKNRVTH